ncbi:tyrosine-type recombinase/integrase [Amycolatopsis roodepoortensis]|uniref:Site-specific recombinase XerD n=1 Tax=Amycolatopsis roodepoortensis TaxID=700274 RepID=A0ABR9LJZ5_9PSEU|nr:tyrosine-type recombinase/integrase [Amycolatopsis roodepoortensis]MBE1580528.1 site-specific recombinase XerD [Amycolatopsis roodepoortensis]
MASALVLGESRDGWSGWDGYGKQLNDLTEEWLEDLARQSRHTARAYGRDLGYRIPVSNPDRTGARSPLLGGMSWWAWVSSRGFDPLTVPEREVKRWLGALDDAGYSANTRGRALAAVRSWYRFLLSKNAFHDVMTVSPAAGVSAAAQGIHLPTHSPTIKLTPDQGAAMIAAADRMKSPMRLRHSATVALLITTAVRVGELCSHAIQDLTYDQGKRKIQVHGKGKRVRMVAVPDLADVRLSRYLDSRPDLKVVVRRGHAGARERVPLLMTRNGKKLARNEVWRLLRHVAEFADLPPEVAAMMTPHATRHSAATFAHLSGADMEQIRLLLGHADMRTTQRYVQASGAELPNAVASMLHAVMPGVA